MNIIGTHDETYWNKRMIGEKIYLAWQVLWGIPKTIIFNLKYFGLQGFRFPVICSYKVRFLLLKGKVSINTKKKGAMIKLGFTAPNMYDNRKLSFVWVNDGHVIFNGDTGIRNGCSIRNYGELNFGENFHISSPSTIICYKAITFGNDVLIGWGCEFSDGDAHKIYQKDDKSMIRLNKDREIIIGNHVWFGANVKVYKGTVLGNNIIVAGSSVLTGSIEGNEQIIGGYPARVIKKDVNWRV